MKKLNVIAKIGLIVFMSIFTLSCDDDDDDMVKTPETIAEIAIATPGLENLVAALSKAGLVDVMNNPGNYTVFAPTNTAFETFLEVNNFDSLDDVPVDVLTQVLLNHVIAKELPAESIITGYENTLATYGSTDSKLSIYINTSNGITLNGVSKVTTTNNVMATNGVIHVVDAVIGIPTVVTFATADPTFSTLVTALTTLTPETPFATILARTNTNSSDGLNPPFTVFAPTNTAFENLEAVPGESVLTQVLLHHVVSGNITSSALTPNGNTTATTLQGENLIITLPGTNGNIANMTDGSGSSDIGIIKVDVQAGNGVIHVINKVAIPAL
ncbi:fasciclin domain-containing protein [Mariniflexile sp.]|uniref:fasciclin domain-containing protein n=1 Tax=Mariniflexile sp. TaxID=1979402 RepID=UPI0035612EF5